MIDNLSIPLKQLRKPKPSKVSFRIIRYSKEMDKEIKYRGTIETRVTLPIIGESYLEDCFAVGTEHIGLGSAKYNLIEV
ncbi:MAG: hypothetical protein ACFFDI_31760 [Promethearchaeota archaeon]